MQNTNYTTLTANAKIEARNQLRTEAILKREARIHQLKTQIKTHLDRAQELELDRDEAIFLLKQNEGHPRFEQIKQETETRVLAFIDDIKEQTERIDKLQESIKEQEEGIEKLKSGETKMNYQAILELANQLIDAHYLSLDLDRPENEESNT